MDLSIIIVNYNTFNLTKNCINSVIKTTNLYSYEIYLVDNASNATDKENLYKEFHEVENICNFFSYNLIPDITFYLDIDPILGFERVDKKNLDRIEMEGISFHQKIRKGFLLLKEKYPSRIFKIVTLVKQSSRNNLQHFKIQW